MAALSTARRVLTALAGAIVFVVLNFLLILDRCRATEFMVDCSGSPGSHTPLVAVIVVLLIGLALVNRTARAFAEGFFGMLVLMAVVTTGWCTPSWKDPYYSYRQAGAAKRMARAQEDRRAAKLAAWFDRLNSRPMEVERGIELAGDAYFCAQRFARDHAGQFPAAEHEMRPCDAFERWSTTAQPAEGIRYSLPDDPPRPQLRGLPTTPRQGDPGWRVQYELDPAVRFVVTVLPDAQLKHRWPRIFINADGLLQVQPHESGPRFDVSPVDDLRQMVECLKGLPAEDERRRGRGLGGYTQRFTTQVQRLCPTLASRVKNVAPAEDYKTFLSIELPIGPNGTNEFVAGWTVEYVQRRPNEPYDFDLIAYPALTPILIYTASMEGDIAVKPR
jgi:hypothetical protein